MTFDPTKYDSTIKKELAKRKVPKSQREDATQECYLSLWAKRSKVELAEGQGKGVEYVAAVCRNCLTDLWRAENQDYPHRRYPGGKVLFAVRPESPIKGDEGPDPTPDLVSEEQLQEAILTLPFDEYRVIYSIFVDGKSGRQTSADLGIGRRVVDRLSKQGVENLKKYFEV